MLLLFSCLFASSLLLSAAFYFFSHICYPLILLSDPFSRRNGKAESMRWIQPVLNTYVISCAVRRSDATALSLYLTTDTNTPSFSAISRTLKVGEGPVIVRCVRVRHLLSLALRSARSLVQEPSDVQTQPHSLYPTTDTITLNFSAVSRTLKGRGKELVTVHVCLL